MGTDIYLGVTITGLPDSDKLLKKLPEWSLLDHEHWGYYEGWEKPDGTRTPGCYNTSGTGRSGDTAEITAWAKKFTAKHPDATVAISEEWSEGDTEMEENVYRAGELVREESKVNAMVPLDLHALLEEAKAALAGWNETVLSTQTYGHEDPDYATPGGRLAEALSTLVKGLS